MRRKPFLKASVRVHSSTSAKVAGVILFSAALAAATERPPVAGLGGAGASAAIVLPSATLPPDQPILPSNCVVVEAEPPPVAANVGVQIAVDAELARGGDWDLDSLRAEARGRGRVVLADGDVLAGRIVTEGLEIPAGATVFVAAGTQIISMGDVLLDGAMVPFVDPPAVSSDLDASTADDVNPAHGDAEAALLIGGCGGLTEVLGLPGVKPPPIAFVFNGRAVIGGLLVGVCAGPNGIQIPNPPFVTAVGVAGARSARAVGGNGGDGVDVTIEGIGNSTLAILGPLCNGRGADGAKAVASAANGPACKCGGDAEAIGGNGGNGGLLTVIAQTIIWNPGLASLKVQPGGAGGGADASAGNGGSCPCSDPAGDGGDAEARAGHAGQPGGVRVLARQNMVPPPAIALAMFATIAPSLGGGAANAFAGAGGGAGACPNCHQSGGPGGHAGDAIAVGGNGGDGMLLLAIAGGVPVAALGSDAGYGGMAQAEAESGGNGGNGGTCPCPVPGPASFGGPGGFGGSAEAHGGKGGDADGGPVAIALELVFAGGGGNASATCGQGGPGGSGGSCFLGFPIECIAGTGGPGGFGGVAKRIGGEGGLATGFASNGVDGVPRPPGNIMNCFDGIAGSNGLTFCPPFFSNCCVPGDLPGCDDPACKETICANNPFCCEVAWDQPCADQANEICAVCQGPSDCCVANGGAGCDDRACEKIVCFVNPLCCDAQWDALCADLANQMCGACAGSS